MNHEISTAFFKGESEEKYKFTVYNWDIIFREGLRGVYIFGKRFKNSDGNFTLNPIFIGEMKDLHFLQGYHRKMDCIMKNGANCKCIYAVQNDARRVAICQDLIDNCDPPCND
ncbi:MAG: hypothetical protein COZ46_01360 [Verrucomicrobia bacterium CG_4_10_14_3_um_filter_43_23]|nr:MAG: hypothetical protein AUJ82_01395 [Verrucomicrobia bacterium CG1_02_43_26]PIP59547.1 MAG: hypothetical protein COX01_02965 [Verrucomicrobia bacterium CG22_combo_CG10-13_8_21_14_all_43_17]PIX58848.1 MAG: hypothetical protein COZ46_01360 [Verrucomicrobia bacterium CG_4_10_14_3_um_filter_43_23]PIY60943.1 MAG: hypothetical protein COY94_08040 [Verrucomicrobia bacterium CG_4_10_14_0_8_um_filter_43_34]PJA44857.1 MAG: hypothetical protein CO175_00850 [Verrucomicrobia bacterium CG_4_9_14_3_um_fi